MCVQQRSCLVGLVASDSFQEARGSLFQCEGESQSCLEGEWQFFPKGTASSFPKGLAAFQEGGQGGLKATGELSSGPVESLPTCCRGLSLAHSCCCCVLCWAMPAHCARQRRQAGRQDHFSRVRGGGWCGSRTTCQWFLCVFVFGCMCVLTQGHSVGGTRQDRLVCAVCVRCVHVCKCLCQWLHLVRQLSGFQCCLASCLTVGGGLHFCVLFGVEPGTVSGKHAAAAAGCSWDML